MGMNGIYRTVSGIFHFTVRFPEKSYYMGGYETFDEAEADKEIYYWARNYLKKRRQDHGKRKYRENRVQYNEWFRRESW